ncbi:hypothetical protein FRC02_010298 [Tulasnella sp. 418]|nr:hypothetical protein FRC02_010298 [Tulasnella sp. 418]
MRRNFTIDDKSPLITYSPSAQWIDGSDADPLFGRYSNGGTFTLTTEKDAKASFTFSGTSVWIFGAKRGNHGPYTSTLDGTNPVTEDGFGADIFQTDLARRTDLPMQSHTIEIANAKVDDTRPYLDVDFITWQTEITDESAATITVEDNHKAIEYLPNASSWSANSCVQIQSYSANSCHQTSDPNASVRLTFQGEVITVFGAVGPSHGIYTATLDSQPPVRLTALRAFQFAKQAIFHASGLGAGPHTLILQPNPSRSGEVFDIDYIEIIGASGDPMITPTSTSTFQSGAMPTASNTVGNSTVKKDSNVGQTVGAAVGITLAVLLVIAVGLILWYRKRHPHTAFAFLRKKQNAEEMMSESHYGLSPASHLGPVPQITPYPSTSYAGTLHTRYSSSNGGGVDGATSYSGGTSSDLRNFQFPTPMVVTNPVGAGHQQSSSQLSVLIPQQHASPNESPVLFRQSPTTPSTQHGHLNGPHPSGTSSSRPLPTAPLLGGEQNTSGKSGYVGSVQRSPDVGSPTSDILDPPPEYSRAS